MPIPLSYCWTGRKVWLNRIPNLCEAKSRDDKDKNEETRATHAELHKYAKKTKKKKNGEGGGDKISNNITYIIDQTGKRDGERNATLLRTCAIDSKDMKVN